MLRRDVVMAADNIGDRIETYRDGDALLKIVEAARIAERDPCTADVVERAGTEVESELTARSSVWRPKSSALSLSSASVS